MHSFSARISAIWRGLLSSFRDFPVEAFLCVSAFVVTLLSNEKVVEADFPLAYFFPARGAVLLSAPDGRPQGLSHLEGLLLRLGASLGSPLFLAA